MSNKLFKVIKTLEKERVFFSLSRQRPDSIMITCTFVGSRIEIDVFEDDHIEYSIFSGDESVLDNEDQLLSLIQDLSK